jgi:hypothetical protein
MVRKPGLANFPDPNSQGAIAMPHVVADEPGYSVAAKLCGA